MKSFRSLGLAALFSAALLLSSSASATMHYFGEMLTSDLMTSAPNYQMEINADLNEAGQLTSINSNTMTAGLGLGNASMNDGGTFSYTHSFGASDQATSIVNAQLSVLTSGNSASNGFAEINLGDSFWLERAMSFSVLGGQVDASLFEDNGELLVNVTASGDQLDLVWSMFQVNYEIDASRAPIGGGPSAAIPEPGAATLFGAGMLIVGTAVRRRGLSS